MSDASKMNGGVPADYVYCIYGGGAGATLTNLIRDAETRVHQARASRTGNEQNAMIADGVHRGLFTIRRNSWPLFGSTPASGIKATELCNQIVRYLAGKNYSGQPTDVVSEIMAEIAKLAKPLSDEQNTPTRQLRRAGIAV